MKRRLPVLLRQLREAVRAARKGYKTSPGPKGQTCESCEYGELFDDDQGSDGWCRLWDADAAQSGWCESWTRSTRLDIPPVKANDSPEQAKDAEPAQKKSKGTAKSGPAVKGKFPFKKRPKPLPLKRPKPLPLKPGGPGEPEEPEAEPEE